MCSLFDPVLLEIIGEWFTVEKSKIIDPFNGGYEKHHVFSSLGHFYTGIELREEQYIVNVNHIKENEINSLCINDDGKNVLNHVKENSQDLIFSCPPYYDLEVYSDDEKDASNQASYNEFLDILDKAYSDSIKCLKDDRFACIVVGDVRDEKGFYYGFIDDVKSIFKKNGMNLYNEMILVESLGTLPQRVGRYMNNRKIGKCHQNVLVFYKGDTSKIKDNYNKIDFKLDLD